MYKRVNLQTLLKYLIYQEFKTLVITVITITASPSPSLPSSKTKSTYRLLPLPPSRSPPSVLLESCSAVNMFFVRICLQYTGCRKQITLLEFHENKSM